MFFNLCKSDFILATKFLPVIDYELKFAKMQLFVNSIITMTTIGRKLLNR